MKKSILKEDLKDLQFLVSKYTKEKKFEKAHECMKDIERIKKELRK